MTDVPNIKELGFQWKSLERVEGDVARLEEDKASTGRRLSELQMELRQAESADREAYAAALLEGNKDEPKKSAADKVKEEHAALEKRLKALDAALQKLGRDRAALVRQNRTGWQHEIREQLPPATAALKEAAAKIEAEVRRVNALVSLLAWTESPEKNYRDINRVGMVRVLDQRGDIGPVLNSLLKNVAEVERAAADNLQKSA